MSYLSYWEMMRINSSSNNPEPDLTNQRCAICSRTKGELFNVARIVDRYTDEMWCIECLEKEQMHEEQIR